jgi:hypothetical protein
MVTKLQRNTHNQNHCALDDGGSTPHTKLQLKKDESFVPQLCMLSQSWNIYIILTKDFKKFANNLTSSLIDIGARQVL